MNNRLLWILCSICFILVSGNELLAQPGDRPRPADRQEMRAERFERIKTARQEFLATELNLTQKEQDSFFPLFWQFDEELKQNRRRFLRDRPHPTDEPAPIVSEAEAKEILEGHIDAEEAILEIRRRAMKAYLEVIPASKLLKLAPAERAFRKTLVERVRGARNGRKGKF